MEDLDCRMGWVTRFSARRNRISSVYSVRKRMRVETGSNVCLQRVDDGLSRRTVATGGVTVGGCYNYLARFLRHRAHYSDQCDQATSLMSAYVLRAADYTSYTANRLIEADTVGSGR
jgi:hypothetical protein